MRSFPSINQFSTNKLKHGCPQEFFCRPIWVKATPPFPRPISSFPFLAFPFLLPSPRCTSLPAKRHLNPIFGEGCICIANYSENQLVLPFLPCPLLSHFPPFSTLLFPSLPPFPSSPLFFSSQVLPFISPNLSLGVWRSGDVSKES